MAKQTAPLTTVEQLGRDPANARRHTPRNLAALAHGLREIGAARSIVIDENGTVLAGNGVVEAAGQAGISKVQVVEADGSTIVAVRRTGLSKNQKAQLAILDNRTNELSEWDADALAALAQGADLDLNNLGFDDDELKDMGIGEDGFSTPPELEEVDLAEPPKMTWVLVGIPTVRFGSVAAHVEAIALVPDVIVETAVSDAKGK